MENKHQKPNKKPILISIATSLVGFFFIFGISPASAKEEVHHIQHSISNYQDTHNNTPNDLPPSNEPEDKNKLDVDNDDYSKYRNNDNIVKENIKYIITQKNYQYISIQKAEDIYRLKPGGI